jgi:hypothetical protein
MFKCKIDGCTGAKHKGHGYCGYHHGRLSRGKEIDVPKRRHNPGAICEVDGCNSVSDSLGLCIKHYARMKKNGDPNIHGKGREYGTGKKWHSNPDGYIVRYEPLNKNSGPNGQVYQHRHVMSQMIGRPLRSSENVHHINGNRADNGPENLELWTRGQPAGQRVQDLVRYAIGIIEQEADAAIALDPSLRDELIALAQRLKML